MRHASTHRRLLARKTTFIQRIYASANDCSMPVTVSTAADHGGQLPLRSGHRSANLDGCFVHKAAVAASAKQMAGALTS